MLGNGLRWEKTQRICVVCPDFENMQKIKKTSDFCAFFSLKKW